MLNVRAGRGISHPILIQIRKGDPMVLYGLKDVWWETPKGYVSADWISYEKVAVSFVAKPRKVLLQLRSGLMSERLMDRVKVGALKYGSKVKIYEQSGSWYRIGSG